MSPAVPPSDSDEDMSSQTSKQGRGDDEDDEDEGGEETGEDEDGEEEEEEVPRAVGTWAKSSRRLYENVSDLRAELENFQDYDRAAQVKKNRKLEEKAARLEAENAATLARIEARQKSKLDDGAITKTLVEQLEAKMKSLELQSQTHQYTQDDLDKAVEKRKAKTEKKLRGHYQPLIDGLGADFEQVLKERNDFLKERDDLAARIAELERQKGKKK